MSTYRRVSGNLCRAAVVVLASFAFFFMAGKAQATTIDGTLEAFEVDYQFFAFGGGSLTIAVNSSDFDTMISLFEDDGSSVGNLTGSLLGTDDDGGSGLNSLLSFASLSEGQYVLAVGAFSMSESIARSGIADENSSAGSYTATFTPDVNVSPVPLPAAGWLLLAGVGGLVATKRRRKYQTAA